MRVTTPAEIAAGLSEALSHSQLRAIVRDGYLLVPTHISWRRADGFVSAGAASLYPFHRRWQGRLDFDPAVRAQLRGEG